jgi:glyoxylase-like metal-dependent hydrolase (beta-lactamase superfamily II)
MKISDRVHLVGSGLFGFDMTDAYDCHIFLLDGGDELALIDAGAGMGAEAILANVKATGHDPGRIRHLILTHAHGDHGGGAAALSRQLDSPAVHISHVGAPWLRKGDEDAISLGPAKAAGIYPDDYVFEPCPVDNELHDGDTIKVGDLSLEVIDTPGHSDGHVSLLTEQDGRRTLFAGDAVFYGGEILLQNIWDCRIDTTISTLRRLRGLEIETLLPGHQNLSLTLGQSHIETANRWLDKLLMPPQMVLAIV